jgi:predicted dehydrogenase
MVLTAKEANGVVESVERARVKMAVTWGAYRFSPPCMELKKKVDEGAIGDLAVANFVMPWGGGPLAGFTCSKDHHERYGGGEVHNFGGYALAYLRWLVGAERPVRRVWAQMGAYFYPDYVKAGNEDLASLSLQFEGGVASNVVTGRLPAACGTVAELSVTGTRGVLSLSNIPTGGMGEVVADFVRAIRGNGRPATDHRDGRAIHLALLAAYESARSGRPVELTAL